MLNFKTTEMTVAPATIGDDVLESFAAGFRGALLRAGDEGYDQARAIWNALIDKRPALIARCSGTADVVQAVNFAREHNLLLSVRGGGHNVAGKAICDDGLMIDLSPMKGIHVDAHRRRVRVQPGVSCGDLDHETQLYGLAMPCGIVSMTGLAGLTLGGGFGWLTRKHGLTVDNLLSAEVVTAEGLVVRAADDENPDLFWGIRGGGGNFGVVTSFEYQLYPLGPEVLAGVLLYPLERADEVLRFYRAFAAGAPDELGSVVVFRLAPVAPFLAPAVHGQPVLALIVCYAGDIEEGQRVLQPLRSFGDPLADLVRPQPYVAHQAILDEGQLPGRNYYWKSEYLSEMSNEAIETAISYSAGIISPYTRVLVFHLGGAAARVDEMATAAGNRNANYVLNIATAWENAAATSGVAENERYIQWTRDFWNDMQPFSTGGGYVNFLSADEGQDRVRAAYGAEKYARLAALKNRYDPANLFRLNQNIVPAG